MVEEYHLEIVKHIYEKIARFAMGTFDRIPMTIAPILNGVSYNGWTGRIEVVRGNLLDLMETLIQFEGYTTPIESVYLYKVYPLKFIEDCHEMNMRMHLFRLSHNIAKNYQILYELHEFLSIQPDLFVANISCVFVKQGNSMIEFSVILNNIELISAMTGTFDRDAIMARWRKASMDGNFSLDYSDLLGDGNGDFKRGCILFSMDAMSRK